MEMHAVQPRFILSAVERVHVRCFDRSIWPTYPFYESVPEQMRADRLYL